MSNASILVVDDQPDVRELLVTYLTLCGFTVDCAEDGRQAVDIARRTQPAVVLMDLMMPRMDGWEATRQLKTDARTSHIHIVAASACAVQLGPHPDAPFDGVMGKPIDLLRLEALLRDLLARSTVR